MKRILITLILLNFIAKAQVCYENEPFILETLLKAKAESWDTLDAGTLRTKIGKLFLGSTYVGGTLEVNEQEMLVVNFKQQDCTTFIEYVMAFSYCIENQQYKTYNYFKALTKIRYRNGVIDGYLSRLHYFSDWIKDNQSKGMVRDISKSLGGVQRQKTINFMSNHLDIYKAIKSEQEILTLKQIEFDLNNQVFYFIPQDSIKAIELLIPNGSIIALTTSISGLDIVHVGLAYKKDEKIYLMHASSDFKSVTISQKPLHDYILGNKSQDGIMVIN